MFGAGPPPPMSKRIFNKYDRDNSGEMDMEELKELMYDLGHPLSDKDFENAKKILDLNGDGKLQYSEFKAWWSQEDRFEQLKSADAHEDPAFSEFLEQAVQHFKYFDKDHNGSIDKDEFKHLYDNLMTHKYPLGTMEQAIKAMDSDGNGEIQLTEYCDYLCKLKFGS
eukprot:m.336364 g.336364  ORF g.336364 m.336364 type:complete len:167 (+) comp17830_c0_seq1:81-581(+)